MIWTKKSIDNQLKDYALEYLKKAKAKPLLEFLDSAKKNNPETYDSVFWSPIIEGYSLQSREAQETFFNYIFNKAKLPKHEVLAKYFTEIINVRWFSPIQKQDTKVLKEYADDLIKAFDLDHYEVDNEVKVLDIEPTEIIENDWDRLPRLNNVIASINNSKVARDLRQVINENNLKTTIDGLHEIIWFTIWLRTHLKTNDPIIDLTNSIESDISWILVEDKMRNKGYRDNPYHELIELYKTGIWPLGLVEQRSAKEGFYNVFLLFIPPIRKSEKD